MSSRRPFLTPRLSRRRGRATTVAVFARGTRGIARPPFASATRTRFVLRDAERRMTRRSEAPTIWLQSAMRALAVPSAPVTGEATF
jgi:hypothetical protein